MTEHGADDELAARLDVALHERLDDTTVDVAALAAGGRRRARHVRTQRLGAAVGALAVLIAVPVGWQLASADRPTDVQSAALLPRQQEQAAEGVPESVGFTAGELPAGSTLSGAAAGASSGSVDPALVAGLNCASSGPSGTAAAQPGSTDNAQQREWRWSGSSDVALTVTRWASTDAAADALTTLAGDTGNCTWNDPVDILRTEVEGSQQTWAAASTTDGRSVVRVVVRVDELVAGVQVVGTDQEDATELAETLAAAEVQKLEQVD
ncbi:hypothetical protein KIH74_20555 [Kineosporia sp. J2-2]|uniref:PknH-like extracellular domain-containing protein n=1 Tax=Kineosporia corallincola TaxID=2835133 RepID=A0ABS5TME0_9ACTN|nr:hypothetical protein [Kineosporia corallincola]MBT0771341.1 hypothetical protein [Kineosporia corallincola]